MLKKLGITTVVLLLIMGIVLISGWSTKVDALRILVLYNKGTDTYLDTMQHLTQTIVVNAEVDKAVWPEAEQKLLQYDAVYLDSSLVESTSVEKLSAALDEYVKKGGMLFIENEFYSVLPKTLIGASDFVKIAKFPDTIEYPVVRDNAAGMQTIVKQFNQDIYRSYTRERLAQIPLGVGVVPSTATPLASVNGIALYSLNKYGDGFVFFCSKLLPNDQFVTGFDLQKRTEQQPYFNYTFATGSYLLQNAFVAFVSKEILGYSVEKVLGTNGRPAMAWQNHFEVMTSIKEGGMEKWIDYLKKYNEIPSFSLIREAYDWGVWKEGLTYYPNIGSTTQPQFAGEYVDSGYSSGKIVQQGDSPFAMGLYPEAKSLADPIALPYRSYADIRDLNQDSVADVLTGSANGEVQLALGVLAGSEWSLGRGESVRLETGEPIDVGAYSSPALVDLDGNDALDLIIGNESGNLRTYINKGDFAFLEEPVGIDTEGISYAAPAVGDVSGDGVEDLIVGTGKGQLLLKLGNRKGKNLRFTDPWKVMKDAHEEIKVSPYAAPRIVDFEGIGRNDILVGDNAGFIKHYEVSSGDVHAGTLIDKGYLEGTSLNPFGDHRLWGGHNSVPAMVDVNNDGLSDLIVGQLAFGFPVPIDSPEFPYRKELERSLAYVAQNFIPIQPHVLVHSFESAKREQEELKLQQKSFAAYGLPWELTGVNQHTWRVNDLDPTQTFMEEMKTGIWWNSGYRPASNPYEPSLAGEYLWTMPFLLAEGDGVKPFMLFNPAPTISMFEKTYASYAKLDMPFTYFYHMEYPILKSEQEGGFANNVKFLDRFRNENDYNFMTEDQMFRSFMATYQARSTIKTPLGRSVLFGLENRLRTKKQLAFKVNTAAGRNVNWVSQPDPKLQEQMENYTQAVGYKVELGEKFMGYFTVSDAPVSMYRGTTLFFGGSSSANISIAPAIPGKPHLERANVPINVEQNGSEVKIDLLEKGMQQLKFFAPYGLEVMSKGWKVDQSEDKNYYVLTRYGDIATLVVNYL